MLIFSCAQTTSFLDSNPPHRPKAVSVKNSFPQFICCRYYTLSYSPHTIFKYHANKTRALMNENRHRICWHQTKTQLAEAKAANILIDISRRGCESGAFLRNCTQVNATPSYGRLFNMDPGNGLVPSDNKLLPEPVLTQTCDVTRPQWINMPCDNTCMIFLWPYNKILPPLYHKIHCSDVTWASWDVSNHKNLLGFFSTAWLGY